MNLPLIYRGIAAVAWAALALPVCAIEDRADIDPSDPLKAGQRVTWKATLSRYRDTASGFATDVNLRGNNDAVTFWLGDYKDPQRRRPVPRGLGKSGAHGSLGPNRLVCTSRQWWLHGLEPHLGWPA
jgi:hypothetical protein